MRKLIEKHMHENKPMMPIMLRATEADTIFEDNTKHAETRRKLRKNERRTQCSL